MDRRFGRFVTLFSAVNFANLHANRRPCGVEKSTPEGVLFSADGLLLKLESTFLRLRAKLA